MRQGRKDVLVDLALERMGWKVLRFEYTAPITVAKVKEICDEIGEEMKK